MPTINIYAVYGLKRSHHVQHITYTHICTHGSTEYIAKFHITSSNTTSKMACSLIVATNDDILCFGYWHIQFTVSKLEKHAAIINILVHFDAVFFFLSFSPSLSLTWKLGNLVFPSVFRWILAMLIGSNFFSDVRVLNFNDFNKCLVVRKLF